MLRRDLRPGTVRIYRWAVADLFDFLHRRGIDEIGGLTRDELERWQDSLRDPDRQPKALTASSRNMAHNAARQMLRFAAEHDLVDWRLERAIVKVRTRQKDPQPIPEADFAKLRAFLLPRRPRMDIVALRDRALWAYLVTTTARVSEALQVRRDDFEAPIVVQKGGTEKRLRIPDVARELVEDYLRARVDKNPWLWIGYRTNTPTDRLRPAGVLKIWKKIARKVGIRPFTTHQLRHTGASALFEARVSDIIIADKMGHHGTGTLHHYTKIPARERERVDEVMEELIAPRRPRLRVLSKIATGPRRPLP